MEIILSNLQAVAVLTDADGVVSRVQYYGDHRWWELSETQNLREFLLPTDRDRIDQILAELDQRSPVMSTFTLSFGMQCYAIIAKGERYYHWMIFPQHQVQVYPEPELTLFRRIFDMVPLDIVIFDPQHRYRYVSPTAVPTPEVRRWILGKTDFDWARERQRPLYIAEQRRQYFQRALRSKEVVSWIEEFPTSDGQIRYFLRSFFPILDDHRNVSWVVGYAVELTDQIGYQRELERINRELEAILQAIQDPVLVLFEGEKIELVNHAAAQLLGQSLDKLRGQRLFGVLRKLHWQEEQLQPLQQALERATTEKVYNCEKILTLSSPEGERFYTLYSTAIELEPEHQIGTVLVLRDVTEEQRRMQELQESEERFRNLVEHSPVPIVIHSEGRIVYCNPAAAKAFALPSPEAMIGRSPYEFIHPDSRQIAHERIKDVYHRYQVAPAIEEKFLRADGSAFEVIVMATPVRWKGKPASQVVFYDISQQKALEDELRRLNQALEEKVEERTAELETALDRLKTALLKEQELNMMKSRFISLVSHEFRTPLTGIISSTELLLRYFDRLSPADRQKHLENILNLSRNLNELLEEIIHLGKVETGKYQPLLEPIEAAQVVKDIVRNFSASHADHIIHIQLQPDPFPILELDKIVLRHVTQNLISNALKYSPPGTEVRITLQYADDVLTLTVCDQGIGIPKSELPYIFQPFHRARNAQLIEGTGLGLAIAHKLVTLCGGQITVESEEGKGSCFTVTLPARQVTDKTATSSEENVP